MKGSRRRHAGVEGEDLNLHLFFYDWAISGPYGLLVKNELNKMGNRIGCGLCYLGGLLIGLGIFIIERVNYKEHGLGLVGPKLFKG